MTDADWPESVPVLTARDVRDRWLGGFLVDAFAMGPHEIYRRVRRVVSNEVRRRCPDSTIDDYDPNARRDVAAAWNAAMRELGYTEIYEVQDD